MKKIINKIIQRQAKAPETSGRITNETVAEHRERVLAGGRKFKYPLQYTKRRVLWLSVTIGVAATAFFVAIFMWVLYVGQSYDQFTYGLTRALPVPVAKVDTEWVRYSDYLSGLRSAVNYLTTKEAFNFNSADGARVLEYQKRLALDSAIQNAFIAKLASQHNIKVSDSEVNEFVKKQVSGKFGVSESDYRRVIQDYYGWTFDEYKDAVHKELLAKKVNAALDTPSRQAIQEVVRQSSQGVAFADLAKAWSEDNATKANGGDVGFVSKNSDDPNGLVAAASALQPGQVSGIIEGTDGFYLVKLLERSSAGDVHFAKIFIAYKQVAQQISDLRKQNKVNEFIKVDQIANSVNRQ